MNAWFTEVQDLSPDQRTSAGNSSPPSSQWNYCFNSGWNSPSLSSLPRSTTHPKSSTDLPVFPRLQFLGYSQINPISGNLSSPQFTSLFRLTFNGVRMWDLKEMTPWRDNDPWNPAKYLHWMPWAQCFPGSPSASDLMGLLLDFELPPFGLILWLYSVFG